MPNSDLVDLRTYILPTYHTILSFSCNAVQTFVVYSIPCWYGISEFLKWSNSVFWGDPGENTGGLFTP